MGKLKTPCILLKTQHIKGVFTFRDFDDAFGPILGPAEPI
jgi:hypothetical protein